MLNAIRAIFILVFCSPLWGQDFRAIILKQVTDASGSSVPDATFAKAFEANRRLNNWNLNEKPIHELDNWDKPQSLAFSGVWDLPVGKNRRFSLAVGPIGGALLNGWTFDWISTYYSGNPTGKDDLNFFCSSHFAAGGQTADHWFNNDKNCYQRRAPYTLRTVEDRFPNIRNPAATQLNIALQKSIKVTERYSLQMRGESFNVANTPIFAGPEANFDNQRFGKLPFTQNNFPRLVQLAAKFIF